MPPVDIRPCPISMAGGTAGTWGTMPVSILDPAVERGPGSKPMNPEPTKLASKRLSAFAGACIYLGRNFWASKQIRVTLYTSYLEVTL